MGERAEVHGDDPGDSPFPSRSSSNCRLMKSPAGCGLTTSLASAAGAGYAAHSGADRRLRAWSADARRSCAADGGTAGVLQFFDTLLPVLAEQVIDVPKIFYEDIATRTPGSW